MTRLAAEDASPIFLPPKTTLLLLIGILEASTKHCSIKTKRTFFTVSTTVQAAWSGLNILYSFVESNLQIFPNAMGSSSSTSTLSGSVMRKMLTSFVDGQPELENVCGELLA